MVAAARTEQAAVPIGTPVYTADGYKLGTFRGANLDEMLIQAGFLFVREMIIPLDEADRYENGRLILRHSKDNLHFVQR